MSATMSAIATGVAPPVLVALLAAPIVGQAILTAVPASYTTSDADSYLWIPGASARSRQQTLIAPSHLQPILGRQITAIELRRTAANEGYAAGAANLTVSMSIAPHTPLRASPEFAANAGPQHAVVFQGLVALPASPPQAGPQMPWNSNNVVRVPLQQPFLYAGGTLCLDIVGDVVPGQSTWWMADAVYDDIRGGVQSRGTGCGSFGGPSGNWAHASERSLLPGAWTEFFAFGTAGGPAIAIFGLPGAATPLSAFGLPSSCLLHLGSLDILLPTWFVPDDAGGVGRAEASFRIPDTAAVFGVANSMQWLDWQQFATSNAIDWTVGAAMPSLDVTLIEGHPAAATGSLSVHLAHVLRFEHQ